MAIPLLGKIIETVVGKGSDIIKEMVTDKDLAKRLDHAFRSQVSTEDSTLKQLELEADKEIFKAQQETIQAELHQSDLYTKRSRPKIARQSWYVTAAYGLAGTFIPTLPADWGLQAPVLDTQMFLVLASPALTYMGVREIGKGIKAWKNGGA